MDTAFAEYLSRVRSERAELGQSMAALESALAEPEDADVSRRRVRAALTELAHDLRVHVELSESSQGIYAELRSTAPRLSTRVDAQLAEHPEMLAEVDRLLAERDDGLSGDEAVAEHRAAVTALLQTLTRHRRRSADLLHEAWDVDLGGSE
jgi:septation ring formation regulator EzrA